MAIGLGLFYLNLKNIIFDIQISKKYNNMIFEYQKNIII